jgi:glycosyltransferase involved in cell wall biosynthesis
MMRAMDRRPAVSIVIPARNEKGRLADTLRGVRRMRERSDGVRWEELIVVDDGSTDGTYEEALLWADRVLRNKRNCGKGRAMDIGWKAAGASDIVLFLDADLGASAEHAFLLLEPILADRADMTVARLPEPTRPGGFGIVKGLARRGIRRLGGFEALAPLSGQRAIRAELLRNIGTLAGGFGADVALTIDAARLGYRICEVAVPFTHRETGRNLPGFWHRGKQFVSVAAVLLARWRAGGAGGEY